MRIPFLVVICVASFSIANGQEHNRLSVELSVRESLTLGTTTLFRGTVTNRSDKIVNSIRVQMIADPQLHAVAYTYQGRDASSVSPCVWNIPSLAPGKSQTFESQMRVVGITSDSVVRFTADLDDEDPVSKTAHFTVKQDGDTKPVVLAPSVIKLFDGRDRSGFRSKRGGAIDWPVEDGSFVSTKGETRSNHISSVTHFRDADIHAEFLLPDSGTGNSGLYIHGHYELQIIDSFGKTNLGEGDAGGIYGFSKPLVNASKPRLEWQTYDVRYRAPRRNQDGEITEKGSISAWLNGIKVQDNVRFGEPKSKYHPYKYKSTEYLKVIWEKQKRTSVGPLFLQDHDNAVRFRNVWIRPLDNMAMKYEE